MASNTQKLWPIIEISFMSKIFLISYSHQQEIYATVPPEVPWKWPHINKPKTMCWCTWSVNLHKIGEIFCETKLIIHVIPLNYAMLTRLRAGSAIFAGAKKHLFRFSIHNWNICCSRFSLCSKQLARHLRSHDKFFHA